MNVSPIAQVSVPVVVVPDGTLAVRNVVLVAAVAFPPLGFVIAAPLGLVTATSLFGASVGPAPAGLTLLAAGPAAIPWDPIVSNGSAAARRRGVVEPVAGPASPVTVP